MELLEVNHLCKTYGSGETAVHALKDVSFSVPKGEYVAVVGESAAIAAQVRKEHPTSSEIKNYQLDNSFLDEVRQWAKLPKEDVDGEAITIPIRKVRLLANYVPANSLHLPLLNLTRILFLRANEEIARSLFILWQDYFTNQDLCYLLYRIVQDKPELVKKIVSNTKLENTTMMQWFPSKNIPYAVGRECMRWQKSDRIRFSDRLMTLGIMPSTRLGQLCIQEYLTFCDRTGYLEISAERRLRYEEQPSFPAAAADRVGDALFYHPYLAGRGRGAVHPLQPICARQLLAGGRVQPAAGGYLHRDQSGQRRCSFELGFHRQHRAAVHLAGKYQRHPDHCRLRSRAGKILFQHPVQPYPPLFYYQ